MHTTFMNRGLEAAVFVAVVLMVGCAPKRVYTPATVPSWNVVEEMMLTPPESLSGDELRRFEEGWSALQQGNLESAQSNLSRLARKYGRSPEVTTALGFLDLRLGSWPASMRYFSAALAERPGFAPAESGYFLAALATGNEEHAYERLLRLQKASPDHPLIARYASTLQVNVAEARLGTARELMEQGRNEDAASAYARALEVAPEVGGLYIEAADAARAAGLHAQAVVHAERATELEPQNGEAFRVLGEARYASDNLAGARDAFRAAARLSPRDADAVARFDAIEAEYQEKNLPPEYDGIGETDRLTRQQLAALLYLELRDAYDGVPETTRVIATDIGDSWAQTFIRHVVGTGILEVFPNHMFQPKAYVRRADLADGLAAAIEILAPAAYDLARESSRFQQNFTDLSSENIHYESAALSISLGLLMARASGDFDPQSLVSGSEAVTAVEVLAAHMAP